MILAGIALFHWKTLSFSYHLITVRHQQAHLSHQSSFEILPCTDSNVNELTTLTLVATEVPSTYAGSFHSIAVESLQAIVG